ncbi:unnamed protein product [Arabis nemorensis]|uniref:Uncharacterized protein n=1 Tax=Arabis nemorensis TaxID=586526 RepID=A0A565C7Y8_9BRAS|nr:unnamed protein product [Arabis nemorensis]
MFKKSFRREDGASRGKNSKRVSNEPASDSMDDDDKTYSSLDYKTPVGSKEPKNADVQDECEIQSIRSSGPNRGNAEVGTSGRMQNETMHSRFPTFHASEQGPWSAMICCVRLCIRSWETDCVSEASYFLKMRNAFGLQKFFLQSEEDLLGNRPSVLVTETTAPKFKRGVGKIELEVGRIKMGSDPLPGCNISSLKPEIINQQIADLNATLSSGWKAVSKVLKKEIVTSHTGPRSVKALQAGAKCGFLCGRVLAQLAAIVDEPQNQKLIKWWAIYHEPEHERIGRIQLHINYSSSLDEKTKCGLVAETSAYDLVLEVAMKAERFQHRKLLIKGPMALDVKEKYKSILSHQENRLLREIDEKVQQILASTFENYKSLDESCFSGIKDVFEPPIKLYGLLNDVLSPEAQLRLCRYFQGAQVTPDQEMKFLILSFKKEISTDIAIHNCNVLPSPIKRGVNAKELFHSYITTGSKRKEILYMNSARPRCEIQGLTSPFVDDMYELLNTTLDDFDIIIKRWPEYASFLEKVIADAERALIEALEKQFSEVLSPLKESKIFALKYVQRLTKTGTSNLYSVPKELGVLLNSMKKVLDKLRSSIENRFKVWNSYFPDKESRVLGDRAAEI